MLSTPFFVCIYLINRVAESQESVAEFMAETILKSAIDGQGLGMVSNILEKGNNKKVLCCNKYSVFWQKRSSSETFRGTTLWWSRGESKATAYVAALYKNKILAEFVAESYIIICKN